MFNALSRAGLCLSPAAAEDLVLTIVSEDGHIPSAEDVREIVARCFAPCDGGRGVAPCMTDLEFWCEVNDVLYSAGAAGEDAADEGCDGGERLERALLALEGLRIMADMERLRETCPPLALLMELRLRSIMEQVGCKNA